MPKVSVIIPAYNAEKYLTQCLNSVQAQTFSDIEVYVIDDGSSDTTPSLTQRFVDEDSRFHLVKQTNQYAGVARNNGMAMATGAFLYFLDADDYIEPDALRLLVEAAEKHGADVTIARSDSVEIETGATEPITSALNNMPFDVALPNESYSSKLFQSFQGWPWDKLFRADFIQQTGLKFQPLRTTNDALFCFCALAEAKTITCVDKTLFHHRTNNSSSLEGSREKSWHCAIEAINAIANRLTEVGTGEGCRQSFRNWVLSYSLWTIFTLSSEAANQYLHELESLLSEFPDNPAQYPVLRERVLLQIIKQTGAKGIRNTITDLDNLERYKDAVENDAMRLREEITDLAELLGEHQREIARLNAEVAHFRDQVDRERTRANIAEEKTEAVYASRSYKLGNKIVAPIRKIKDLIKR